MLKMEEVRIKYVSFKFIENKPKKNKEIENILDFVSNQETERCSFFAYKRTLIMNLCKKVRLEQKQNVWEKDGNLRKK